MEQVRIVKEMRGRPPLRGAWIEIVKYIGDVDWSKSPPLRGAWIEMVLSISNGMLFSFLVHRIVSFPVIHLAEQKSPYYTASFCAAGLSSTARS